MSGQTLAQISRAASDRSAALHAAFLVAPPSPAVLQQAEAFAQSVRAASTRAAYAADWQHFEQWCACRGFASLPAEPGAVALYLTEAASSELFSVATLQRRLVAVAQRHIEQGLEPPTRAVRVRSVFRGIRRQIGTAQRRKAPMLPEDLEKVLPTFGDGIKGVRNKALLLLGFAGAFRRAELVSLDWKDIAEERQGLTIVIRRSKTDQFGAGRQVAIPYAKNKALCPVAALKEWKQAQGKTSGPVFRSLDRHGNIKERLPAVAVASVVKEAATALGFDPALYGGHSLRAGLVTSAAQAGVEEWRIQQQTGHKSAEMLRRYIRPADAFTGNAAGRVL